MSLPHISAADARLLVERGALLVDIRTAPENARERIPAARHHDLATLAGQKLGAGHTAVVFQCQSGGRTRRCAELLAASAAVDAFVLEGGIAAWKKAGFAVEQADRQPMAVNRQMEIVAGSLALLGVGLGALVHPAFYGLSGAVGAALVTDGATGAAAVQRLLEKLPWNRVAA
jgi:rhodanese-related sulfurtransferase